MKEFKEFLVIMAAVIIFLGGTALGIQRLVDGHWIWQPDPLLQETATLNAKMEQDQMTFDKVWEDLRKEIDAFNVACDKQGGVAMGGECFKKSALIQIK